MKLLALACCPVLLVVEVYRRGFVAPIAFGVRQWLAASRLDDEPEMIG